MRKENRAIFQLLMQAIPALIRIETLAVSFTPLVKYGKLLQFMSINNPVSSWFARALP